VELEILVGLQNREVLKMKVITLNNEIINIGEWDYKKKTLGDSTETVTNPLPEGAIEEDLEVSYTTDGKIVKTTDYYNLRQSEYPYIGDQLDAMWKGLKSLSIQDADFTNMLIQIENIKNKYPKPTQ
jgi:hypothetical protein